MKDAAAAAARGKRTKTQAKACRHKSEPRQEKAVWTELTRQQNDEHARISPGHYHAQREKVRSVSALFHLTQTGDSAAAQETNETCKRSESTAKGKAQARDRHCNELRWQ